MKKYNGESRSRIMHRWRSFIAARNCEVIVAAKLSSSKFGFDSVTSVINMKIALLALLAAALPSAMYSLWPLTKVDEPSRVLADELTDVFGALENVFTARSFASSVLPLDVKDSPTALEIQVRT
jgi:hypothetical protein